MLLSELVFQSIKRTLGNIETDFTYESFMAGDFDSDYRVLEAKNNIFLYINEAIARLADLNKIQHIVYRLISIDGVILLPNDIKQIHAVQDYYGNQYQFIKIEKNELFIDVVGKERMLVEITQDLYLVPDEEVELQDCGISNQMCSYIIEYVLGKSLEETSPSEANVHISSAESYFTNLPSATNILKRKVQPTYKM
jgi:hypothetical protein